MALLIQFKEIPFRKASWSVEEDDKLIGYIRKHGIWNWNAMAKAAGLARSGKSCRLRWMNYLRPNVKHGNFTKEEDETILKLHKKYGNRWTKIASKLPERTDNDIKNHFNTRLIKIAEKELVKLHGSSSSGQASPLKSNPEDHTPEQNASSSLNPTSLEPSPTSSTNSNNFTSGQSMEEKETGEYCWVDHQQFSVEMKCEDVGAMSSDYEGYGLDEYGFYLQGGANTIFDEYLLPSKWLKPKSSDMSKI